MTATARHQRAALSKFVSDHVRSRGRGDLERLLVAEHAIGKQQDIEATEPRNNFPEFGVGVDLGAIERDDISVRGAARLQDPPR